MPRARNTNGPGKGGPRQGAPGQAYANRSDLTQPGAAPTPAAAPAQGTMVQPRGYGAATPPAPPVASAPSSPTAPVGQQGMPPQGMGTPPALDLNAPTQRPQEPVTAGIPFGPGANSMQMPGPMQQDTLGLGLRELYRAQPSEDVRQLIVNHEAKGQPAPQGALPPQQGPPTPPRPSPPVAPRAPLARPTPGPRQPPPVIPPGSPVVQQPPLASQ